MQSHLKRLFAEAALTTTRTELPPMRPYTPEECEALVSASIIADGEQADVLSGARLFTQDDCKVAEMP